MSNLHFSSASSPFTDASQTSRSLRRSPREFQRHFREKTIRCSAERSRTSSEGFASSIKWRKRGLPNRGTPKNTKKPRPNRLFRWQNAARRRVWVYNRNGRFWCLSKWFSSSSYALSGLGGITPVHKTDPSRERLAEGCALRINEQFLNPDRAAWRVVEWISLRVESLQLPRIYPSPYSEYLYDRYERWYAIVYVIFLQSQTGKVIFTRTTN